MKLMGRKGYGRNSKRKSKGGRILMVDFKYRRLGLGRFIGRMDPWDPIDGPWIDRRSVDGDRRSFLDFKNLKVYLGSADTIDGLSIKRRPFDGFPRHLHQTNFCSFLILPPAHVMIVMPLFIYFSRNLSDMDPILISSTQNKENETLREIKQNYVSFYMENSTYRWLECTPWDTSQEALALTSWHNSCPFDYSDFIKMVGLNHFVNTLPIPQIDLYPLSIECEPCAFLVL